MSWRRLEAEEPEIADTAIREFRRAPMALIGTIRRDGTPRISSVEVVVVDGELYMAMMWRSRKALDLRRDPRILLRNPVSTNIGDEVEVNVRGRAVEITEGTLREKYLAAAGTPWEGDFHLFRLEVDGASLIRYGQGRQRTRVWPSGKETTRSYP